jgi:hypothetical protein
MKRRLWLLVLILYAIGAVADGAYRLARPPTPTSHPSDLSTVAVAFCAALFWPIDIVAGPLLGPH